MAKSARQEEAQEKSRRGHQKITPAPPEENYRIDALSLS
jgi:hypothetical protein